MKVLSYITITAFLLLLLQGCGSEEGGEDEFSRVLPAVEAVQAQFGSLPLEERLNGIVRAANQVDIYPEISAPIETVYVQNGDRVNQGDVLVQLRDGEYRERLRQAEANLRISIAQEKQAQAALGEVEAELKRIRILAQQDLTSDLELEQSEAQLQSAEASHELAQARVEQARASLEEQRDALDQTQILAPVSGTVGQRNAEIGMQVNSSTRLFTIGDLSESKITINLTERMLSYIGTEQSVRIFSENLADTVLTAEISRISPFLGAGNFSTEAEIDIRNEGNVLMPGMFVTVDVLYGESEQATIIPLSSIHRNPQTGVSGVYIAPSFGIESELMEQPEDGSEANLSNPTDVEFVPIEVIAQGREAAGVTGIRSGQWVVTVGHNLLERDNSGQARVRPTTWNNIMEMQQLRPEDLLEDIMNTGVVETTQSSTSSQL
ncbi:efflux RND transporter periplasmic adaptor subunit [Rhodohalobacter sp. 614A]|uniref:efflux RND transporter periplasmic adaptor subunit n=1 Tax=Rhodohalobacter sp. 614A TaxID=2908649 RepID=UPI001F450B1D|nr:efflux RND transporter periplasmic adaptor subunit [Rhodohalobacter sp. 614A]